MGFKNPKMSSKNWHKKLELDQQQDENQEIQELPKTQTLSTRLE